jgi:phage baseplate assembly protein W
MGKQFYGIKYPFSEESRRMTFFDINETKEDSIRSMFLHILLTPKGQRLRHPNFGTNLINFIFEPNDDTTWDKIKSEIKNQVSFYLPQVNFNDINIIDNEEDKEGIYLEIDYDIENNGKRSKNKTVVKI